MRDTKNLELRHQTWHCVKEVPRPLRKTIGKKRFVLSLKTHDLKLAQVRRYEALVAFEREIAAARQTTDDPKIIETAMELRASIDRIKAGDQATIKAYWGHSGLGYSQDDSPQQVALMLAEESVATMTWHLRDTGEDTLASTFADVATGRATPLLHYLDAWLNEGGGRGPYKERTKSQHRTDIQRLVTWVAAKSVPPTVEAFTRRIAGQYVSETIVAAKIDVATGNRWLSAASSYWRWMMKRGGIEANPWTGQSLAKPAAHRTDRARKRPFTEAEMVALLAGNAGPELSDLMRVAALSGMRLEEMYRLTVADCAAGWFAVRVSKTAAGRRRVPIHSDLEPIITRRSANKAVSAFLFHEASNGNADRERSSAVSKRFGHYRRDQGVHDRAEDARHSAVDFHSFRRWFITTAEQAGQPPHIISAVVGHEEGRKGMTLGTYSGGPSDEQLRACVASVRSHTLAGHRPLSAPV